MAADALPAQRADQTDQPSRFEPSDEEIVEAALQDLSRFGLIYQRYADDVYKYALARVRSPDIAADLVGETMLSAMESLGQFDSSRGSFRAWLFTIAGRRVTDRDRGQRRWLRFIKRHYQRSENVSTLEGSDPADVIRTEMDAKAIHRAIASLPVASRDIVVLRYAAGLTSREIGDAVGLSPGAVRMRLARALDHLAQALEEYKDE